MYVYVHEYIHMYNMYVYVYMYVCILECVSVYEQSVYMYAKTVKLGGLVCHIGTKNMLKYVF